MRRRHAVRSIAAGLFGLAGPLRDASSSPNAQAMLVASDAVRNPGQPFRVTVTLTEFENGQQVDTSTLVSYARVLPGSGQFATLIHFVQPTRDAGKLMLKNGKELWFFDPGTKASVRISPQQRLMGEASNGDVITVNFARDYQATLAGSETLTDGERRSRKANKLVLAASTEDATYSGAELWIDATTHAPIKARFLAESGRLLKTAYYRRFSAHLGADRPTETVIIDGLNPQAVTIVRMSEFAAKNVPTTWFQREFLPNFKGE